jgi:hypothetical protein
MQTDGFIIVTHAGPRQMEFDFAVEMTKKFWQKIYAFDWVKGRWLIPLN